VTADARAALVARRSETEWQNALIGYAHAAGYLVTAMKDSRALWWGCDKGVPDLICVHPTRGVLWIECKTTRGRLKPEQKQWADTLARAGQQVYTLTPADQDYALRLFGLDASMIARVRVGERAA
jgi:hypothetical protein